MKNWLQYSWAIGFFTIAVVGGYFLNRQLIDKRVESFIGFSGFSLSHKYSPKIAGKGIVPISGKVEDNIANASGEIAQAVKPSIVKAKENDLNIKGAVPVLMYHYIGDLPDNADSVRKDLTVSTQNFEQQVSYLDQQGYTTITLDQLHDYLTKGTQIPDKSVIFSFDDGYADTFENAIPILEAHHMTGVFGIITGFVGTNTVYADWQQITGAQKQGMTIVSHSYSHPNFSILSSLDADYNVAKSTVDLTQELGTAPVYFIYPYGKYNSTTEEVLKNHGFVMSFTTAYGFDRPGENLLELPRIRVHGSEPLNTFSCEIAANCKTVADQGE